jgi:hypothetical protein
MESGKFFEGFVESIAGMKAGDTKTVPVTFPENHKARILPTRMRVYRKIDQSQIATPYASLFPHMYCIEQASEKRA